MVHLIISVKWSFYQREYDLYVLNSWEDFRRIVIQKAIFAVQYNHGAQPFAVKPRVRVHFAK